MRSSRLWFRTCAALLAAYALVFPLITADALLYLASNAEIFETRNFVVVVFLEMSRLLTSLIGIGAAVFLMAAAADRADGRAMTLFLLFVTITLEKKLGAGAVPGPGQEAVTLALRGAGVSAGVLRALFGPHAWTLWPALAALLRFSAVFPRALEADVLTGSARYDRRGWLRGQGMAGADIGSAFRRLSLLLLQRAFYRPLFLGGFALAAVVLHVYAPSALQVVLWIAALAALGTAIANLRAAYVAAGPPERARIAWITQGLVLGVTMFLIAAVIELLLHTGPARAAAFAIITLAPAVVMACLALSVTGTRVDAAEKRVRNSVRAGAIALALTLVFCAVYAAADAVAVQSGMPRALSALGALVLTAAVATPVSRLVDRWRVSVLESESTQEGTG